VISLVVWFDHCRCVCISKMAEQPIEKLEDLIQTTDTGYEQEPAQKGEIVKFSVNFKKQNYDIEFGNEDTLNNLRLHIAQITGVAPGLQKLMLKGLLKDDSKTLKELNITNGSKMMLIGSTISEVMSAQAPPPQERTDSKEEEAKKEPLSDQMPHKRIIEKGVPEGAIAGIKGKNEPLPTTSINAIYNNIGVRVRLTFKMWTQELWIQSASSSQKIPYASIRNVVAEPIKGREEYYIIGLQLGASERNKYYLYYVPCQYVRAIKSALAADYIGGY